ncbi:MAG TPA: MEDS domain-containing protein [Vicinamibacterales bacterium]|nr:MEDS domain-containing protein [Vicinamibacterales bacterium]
MARKDVPAARPYHAVQFYGSDDRLFCAVGRFLAEGLIEGQPAVVIAGPAHRAGILHQLSARLIDVDRARRDGDLLLLDSEEMLDLFMANGAPDSVAFESNIGRFIRQMLQGREGAGLRAYGDMVNLLWQRSQPDAAIQLELLWNKLAQRFGISLLCGYAMGHFCNQTSELHAICEHHSHIFGPEHASTFAKPTAH